MKHIIQLTALLLLSGGSTLAKDPALPSEKLDFTQGDTLPRQISHDWTLGPIGARGWCQVSKYGAEGTTKDSRQILITKVDSKGTAAEWLQKGDVIIGVDETPFQSDARIAFAKAISSAEEKGVFSLLRHRDGQVTPISIPLPTRPPFANTAPFDCPKSAQILKEGCDHLASRGLGSPAIDTHLNALALLATGDRAYKDELEQHVKKTLARPLSADMPLACWHFAFANLFLTEYYLITGDRYVLPEIRRLSGHLVAGQGPLGTWGHTFAEPTTDRLRGYGAVNAVGIPVAISLVLARECGQDFAGLDECIEQAATFFRRHVGIGAIPYGDGPPNLEYGHDDNGKNSAAAVFFSLLNDAPATAFYTRTALASYGLDREQGHTGNFFNMLWSVPAVALAGPTASGAWMNEFGWYHDLARDANYRFPYQGYPSQTPGNAYAKWDCPGAYLLHFAAPLKKLRILGRGVTCQPKLTTKEITETLEAGKINYRYASPEFLRESLSSWSPIVRNLSAKELRRRKIGLDSPASLTSSNPLDRIAALKSSKNFDQCQPLLADPDLRVRMTAISSLAGKDKKRAVAAVFEHLAKHSEKDPVFTQAIGNTFFPLGISEKAVGQLLNAPKDRETTIKAINILLNDEDALVSSRIAMGLKFLPDEELIPLLPLVYHRAANPPAGNVMFANKLQTSCAGVLVHLRLEEGLETSANLLADESWGRNNRLPQAAALLIQYKGYAKKGLKPVKDTIAGMTSPGDVKWKKLLQDSVDIIEACETPKDKLPTIESITKDFKNR
ncbi:DUF6288 domain-containing protein [Roseibacillus persicicus]|uniref:Acetylesterase n=1 Tax=Roseibacillus persicicus TaxID=454148 RepID=A0A918TLB7_9BACT|nr:DUF6288 domain-containing protein [Roseibacillus persicicus]MDQ8189717.1 DUF6288 domain-containing protein [Roseibacillus persicicus]GHC50094.1 hypothetical protein GCM10007100_15180 [Roseibacillus persicicus]